MQNFFQQLSSNNLLLFLFAVLAVLLLISLVKRVIKLMIFLGLALILFVGYLHYTGQEVPSTKDVRESMDQKVGEVKESAREAINSAVSDAINSATEDLIGTSNPD